MSGRPRLDSWKDIARHLRRDVRTVIRWERDRRLPVYRVPGGKVSRVFAYPDELDAWLANGSIDPRAERAGSSPHDAGRPVASPGAPRVRGAALIAAAAATSVAVAGVIAWALAHAAGPARTFAMAGSDLVALDAAGRISWTHPFAPAHVSPASARWTEVIDLDRDGRDDVLAAVQVNTASLNAQTGELLRFSGDGHLQWAYTADDHLNFRQGAYGPPWPAADFTTVRSGSEGGVALALHHFTWWPSLLVTLNARGERIGTFVNSGWIHTVRQVSDGGYLLVSGVTNSRNAYFLAALDATHPTGHSPEPPGSVTECVGCPAGDPIAYLVWPRTDVGLAQPFPQEGPVIHTFEDGRIQVQTLESGLPGVAAAIYELSSDLQLTGARVSDSFWDWHRRLEVAGMVDHSAEACPQRKAVEVQAWTPAGGWRTMTVDAGNAVSR
jgi:hypothetical protein